MTTYVIDTKKYDIDLDRLLSRRLQQSGCNCTIMRGVDNVCVTVEDDSAIRRLSEALSMLLCRDLKHFELAKYVDTLPLTLPEKQAVLKSAVRWTRTNERLAQVCRELRAYLLESDTLHLEGYMLFRMGACLSAWREGVQRAVEERLLTREYAELMSAMSEFVALKRPGIGELAVCIHPDGSCTLTDDSNARIEYVDCSDDGIVSLLVGMAPERLIVYDLSCGAGEPLANALKRVFAGRVRVYRS